MWSIAECFDHLIVAAREYLPKLDEGIADAIRRGTFGEARFRYALPGRLWVWAMEPPPRLRVKAPRFFHPASGRPRNEVMAGLRAYQRAGHPRELADAAGLDAAVGGRHAGADVRRYAERRPNDDRRDIYAGRQAAVPDAHAGHA